MAKSNVGPVCRSSLVNERQEDKTALQVAAHEGHTQVRVMFVLSGDENNTRPEP